jgi:hypothetical protein
MHLPQALVALVDIGRAGGRGDSGADPSLA